MNVVILDKGKEGTRVFRDPTQKRAAQRAESLAHLHGCEAVKDREGDWYVDASDFYSDPSPDDERTP